MIGQVFAAAIGAAIMAFAFSKLGERGQSILGTASVIFCVAITIVAVALVSSWTPTGW